MLYLSGQLFYDWSTLIVVFILLCGTVLFYIKLSAVINENESFVVPHFLPYFGHLFQYMRDPLKFLLSCRQRYGSTFTLKVMGQRTTFVMDPRNWNAIIKNSNLSFPGTELATRAFGITPDALGHDEIDVQMRKDYPKGLQNDSLKELIAHFVQNIREEMIKDKQELKNTIKTCGLLDLCHLMIFVPSIRTIYGEIDVHSYEKSFEKFNSNIQLLFINVPSFIKSTFFQKTLNARDYLIQQLSNIEHVQNQSRMTKMRTDLMKMYPQYFSSSDIGGNHLAFLWASVGNTIPAAFWTLFHILRDCRALEQLQEEVRENLPVLKLDENIEFDENSWTVEKLAKCVLLESAVNETLRMYGAPMMLRTCSSNTQIQTYDGKTLSIRKNDRISLFPAASHYDERLFHEPFIYKFDRFLNNTIINNLELDRQKVPIAYMPFGTGKTMCPGKYFAKNEIKICLALIFQQIEYKFIDETTPKTRADRVGFGVAPPSKDVQIQYWYQ